MLSTTYLRDLFLKNLKNNYRSNRRFNRFEIHATDIKDLCLREFLILYKKGIKYQKSFFIRDRTYLTFKIGDKIEDIVRENLEGIKPPPFILKLKDIFITGSPDIIVKDSKGLRYIIECKSIKKEDYVLLEAPIPTHILQISFYLWFSKKYLKGFADYGFITYVPKQEAEPIIKVFKVALEDRYRKIFENLVNRIKKFLKTGELPERVCSSVNSSLARNCSVRSLCFRLDK